MRNWSKVASYVGAIALSATVSVASAQTKTGTVKIGSNIELSGNFVAVGGPPATAIRMAVKEINDRGGFVVGDTTYKFQLIEADDKGVAATAVSEMLRLVEDEKVKAVFGPMLGALAGPTGEISNSAKVLHFTPSSLWQVNGYLADAARPLFFDTQVALTQVASTDVEGMKQIGAKKVAFIALDDETTKSNFVPFQKVMAEAGIAVEAILFPAGTTDFSSYVTRAKSSADAIYYLYPQALAPDVLRTVVDLFPNAKGFGARATDPNIALKGINGKPLPFPYFTSFNTPSVDYPVTDKVRDFSARLKAFSPNLSGPTVSFVFFAYDFVYMLAESMKVAGTVDDTIKIGQALTALKFDGVAGRVCFPGGIRIASMDGSLITVRDGKLEAKLAPSGC